MYVLHLRLALLLVTITTCTPGFLPAQNHRIVSHLDIPIHYISEGMKVMKTKESHQSFINRFDIASRLLDMGKPEAAIYWYYSCLNDTIKNDTTTNNARRLSVYASLSQVFRSIGDYEKATEMHLHALRIPHDSFMKGQLIINLSDIYVATQNYEMAYNHLEEALSLLLPFKDTLYIAYALERQGAVLGKMGLEDKALYFFLKAYHIISNLDIESIGDLYVRSASINQQAYILSHLGNSYLLSNQTDSALYCLNSTQNYFDKLTEGNKAVIHIAYGKSYIQTGELKKALSHLHQAQEIIRTGNFKILNSDLLQPLSEVYALNKKYKQAWEYQKEYLKAYEEKTSEENRQQVNLLQKKYTLARQDKEITERELMAKHHQLELNKRDNRFYFFLTTGIFSAIVITIIIRNQYNKQRYLKALVKNANKEAQITQVEATLKGEERERERVAQELHDSIVSEMLAFKINLKNMENVYPNLKQSPDFSDVLFQTDELTDKLRRTAHNMMPVKLKESGLVKTIAAFVQRINNHKLQIQFQCLGEAIKLHDTTEKIILNITHELIQNIIKHAKASEAIVQLTYFEELLSLTVEDNGVGIVQGHKQLIGMGWKNIQKNVELLGGVVDVQSSEYSGTTILIELSIQQHREDNIDCSVRKEPKQGYNFFSRF